MESARASTAGAGGPKKARNTMYVPGRCTGLCYQRGLAQGEGKVAKASKGRRAGSDD